MKTSPLLISLLALTGLALAQDSNWTAQTSGVTARLRGVSAVNAKVAWASGADLSLLRTADGGANWIKLKPPADADKLDFRDIDAIDERTAYALSIGPGPASRIYKTVDAGASWQLQHQNTEAQGFYDAMTFWDARHGLVVGDSIDGRFQILVTRDGGAHWDKVPDAALPPALPGEGAFAGSGSNIAVMGSGQDRREAWIVTNSPGRSRVLHTADGGKRWQVVDTPLAASATAGIFSVHFRDRLHGVIVGGDYKQEQAAVDNAAFTSDGGKTWTLVKQPQGLSGFRSVVKHLPGSKSSWIAVGPQGADRSDDDGKTWQPMPLAAGMAGFDALSFAPGLKQGWASGAAGALAGLRLAR
ncbi:hypothetical protein [Pelomonas sp. SE-A7]|uniref:WD40/YVTN/BNR-like repeat-containing protein n=1 Tax=Pelomonas sp. SE-A7 TaxID=3054953 RepID=UPI00259D1F9F|nr:hypothetical protein [Pelomonas sp. SE-A7]MDM4767751.1 hypothetical protein [Pelomonas sp. SE-A7]